MAHDRDSPVRSDQSGYEADLFRTVMFGYERSHVDDYVNALRNEVHVLTGGLQRLLPLEAELAVERAEAQRLRSDLAAQSMGATASTRIQDMLRLAEEEATALRRSAETLLAEATADADRIRRVARMDAELAAAAHRRENQAEAARLLAKARAEANRVLAEARGRSLPAEASKINGEPRQSGGTPNAGPSGAANGSKRNSDRPAKKKKRSANISPHAQEAAVT